MAYREAPPFPAIVRALPWRSLSLGAVALVSTVAWRAELYARGWAGLAWTGYFHRAIALGVALFIAWAVAAARVPTTGRRVALGVALVAASAPLYVAAILAAGATWNRWGGAPLLGVLLGALPLIAVLAIAALVGVRPSGWRRAAAVALWLGALPLGVLWLQLTAPEFADAVHAIKTGAAIPWLVIALGLPFLRRGG